MNTLPTVPPAAASAPAAVLGVEHDANLSAAVDCFIRSPEQYGVISTCWLAHLVEIAATRLGDVLVTVDRPEEAVDAVAFGLDTLRLFDSEVARRVLMALAKSQPSILPAMRGYGWVGLADLLVDPEHADLTVRHGELR